MMTRDEKLTEAKLMAVEKLVDEVYNKGCRHGGFDGYEYAKEILLAIHNAEIAEELRQHESNLLTRDEKPV